MYVLPHLNKYVRDRCFRPESFVTATESLASYSITKLEDKKLNLSDKQGLYFYLIDFFYKK